MFRLMEKARENNKGFSLVELIVVVLIIAIIAVALAPQVMKYVGKARNSVSENNAATVKSAVQAAVAEYQGENTAYATAGTYKIVIKAESTDSVAKKIEKTTGGMPTDLKNNIANNIGTDKLDDKYTAIITVTSDANDATKFNTTVKVEKGDKTTSADTADK